MCARSNPKQMRCSHFYFQAAIDPRLEGVNGAERTLAHAFHILFPVVLCFILTSFFMTILLQPYYEIKKEDGDHPSGVPTVS